MFKKYEHFFFSLQISSGAEHYFSGYFFKPRPPDINNNKLAINCGKINGRDVRINFCTVLERAFSFGTGPIKLPYGSGPGLKISILQTSRLHLFKHFNLFNCNLEKVVDLHICANRNRLVCVSRYRMLCLNLAEVGRMLGYGRKKKSLNNKRQDRQHTVCRGT